MNLVRPLVVLDLETTGTWIEKDRIVEMAFVRCEPDGSTRTYLKRINPGIPIPAAISRLIGITDEDVKDAPAFKTVAQEALDFISNADFGGFNVERFDLPLLEREMYEAGLKFEWRDRRVYDAQRVYHYHEKRDLTAAYKFYCQKELVNAHTALADTEATLEILRAQVARYGNGDPSVDCLKSFSVERADDFYDSQRKFRWWNGELYPMFGKYARRHNIRELCQKDRGYLEWLLTTDFEGPVKAMLKDALAGTLPTRLQSDPVKA